MWTRTEPGPWQGGAVVSEAKDYMYGERQYADTDPSGRRWLFTQSIADLAPEDWGARGGEPD